MSVAAIPTFATCFIRLRVKDFLDGRAYGFAGGYPLTIAAPTGAGAFPFGAGGGTSCATTPGP